MVFQKIKKFLGAFSAPKKVLRRLSDGMEWEILDETESTYTICLPFLMTAMIPASFLLNPPRVISKEDKDYVVID
jgi:hypothetical protein